MILLHLLSTVTQAVPPAESWMDSVVLLTVGPSICAGVLIDEKGTIATAYHCVAAGRRPRVETRDGASTLGEILATSPRDDLALVAAPDLAGRVPLLIREADLEPGEVVYAIGHPLGSNQGRLFNGLLRWSITSGIVSAVGERLTQVDAPLNPGNSGGPLLDEQGRIAGIASRKLKADNIAFMSPASKLHALVNLPQEPKWLGGQWMPGLGASLPFAADSAVSAGIESEIWLRDRLLIGGSAYLPLGANWLALERGEIHWSSAELRAAARVRVGRGALSTALDLGIGGVWTTALTGSVAGEEISLYHHLPELHPALWGRVIFSGMGVRWTFLPGEEGWSAPEYGVSIDLFPGTLWVF